MFTRTGRVIYRRRPHLFSYRDVLRIVRKVPPRDELGIPSTEIGDMFLTILAAEADLLEALGKRGLRLFPEMTQTAWLLAMLNNFFEILGKTGENTQANIIQRLWKIVFPGLEPKAAAEPDELESEIAADISAEEKTDGEELDQG